MTNVAGPFDIFVWKYVFQTHIFECGKRYLRICPFGTVRAEQSLCNVSCNTVPAGQSRQNCPCWTVWLKEKLLAAHRGGITKVLIPKENEKDITEIPKNIRKGIELILVEDADDVLRQALELEDPKNFLSEKVRYDIDIYSTSKKEDKSADDQGIVH